MKYIIDKWDGNPYNRVVLIFQYKSIQYMRPWRNRQTRTFEGRVGDHTGSSPVLRTKDRHAVACRILLLKNWREGSVPCRPKRGLRLSARAEHWAQRLRSHSAPDVPLCRTERARRPLPRSVFVGRRARPYFVLALFAALHPPCGGCGQEAPQG